MSIEFLEQENQFHIYNEHFSYVMFVMANEQMGQLYYGAPLPTGVSYRYLYQENMRPLGVISVPRPGKVCLQYTKQEYASFGGADFRATPCRVQQENGSFITEFRYEGYEIFQGKKSLEPLPATYVEDDAEATTLEIRLYDSVMDCHLVLSYTVYETLPILCRNARYEMHGTTPITLDCAMSASVDFPDRDFTVMQLSGAWARERQVVQHKVQSGLHTICSRGGASSAEQNPFLALSRTGATETAGEVYGFSLVYSGNFRATTEVCCYDTTRVMLGINPEFFSWTLGAGETFQTPEVVMAYSQTGFTGMSRAYHTLYRTRLARGVWRDKERPILFNNWEATHMKFTQDTVVGLAEEASKLGMELFVLDDGWFGARDNDSAGLGDWYVNRDKLKDGIDGLANAVNDMGMQFGLWIEPEMVNKDSDLYRAHPDYILQTPDRFVSFGRKQYVLDFSRTEVIDCIYNQLIEVIDGANITYIKWDMNRYITECYSASASANEQGKVMHKYILGVYELYRRLTTRYPNILFESCASGGARFDPAMLYYAPQAWCSDDTDAGERMRIQYGTSMVYPISSMGAHVSAVPNHHLDRTISVDTRANVAFFGAFGYELNLKEVPECDKVKIKAQVEFYKKWRPVMQFGTLHRITSPFDSNEMCWITVTEDKTKAVGAYYQQNNRVNAGYLTVKFAGLAPEKQYKVTYFGESTVLLGAQIMRAGLPVSRVSLKENDGDYASVLFTFEVVE